MQQTLIGMSLLNNAITQLTNQLIVAAAATPFRFLDQTCWQRLINISCSTIKYSLGQIRKPNLSDQPADQHHHEGLIETTEEATARFYEHRFSITSIPELDVSQTDSCSTNC